jgi:hypothetical protein
MTEDLSQAPGEDAAAHMGADEPAGVHALADMFFTLGAMALFTVALSAGAARETAPAGVLLKATAQGVVHQGGIAPLDSLLDDASLLARLAQARAQGQTIVVTIAPDGLEAAFALESLLGGMRVRQQRLTGREAAVPGTPPRP